MNLKQIFKRIYIQAPEPIPSEHRTLLLLIGAAMLIAGYDVNIYGLAIPQIQQSLNIAESDVGRIVVIFRLGMIPAIGLSYLADRIGRRNLLMATLAGATLATIWTAFAQSLPEFVAAQTLARVCIYTEELLCVVVIAEEFNERTRGWAMGQLGAMAALGAGLAALVFGFVNMLPFGWRAIYLLGAVPLLWLLWARRTLKETSRFRDHQALKSPIGPIASLLQHYPMRLLLLVCITVTYSFGMGSGIIFVSKHLQSAHGWSPAQVTMLIIGAGTIGVLGNIAAGILSDRFGRRIVLTITVLVSAAAYASFYTWATGLWLPVLWTIGIFTYMASDIIISAFGAELFPTSHRSLASAIRLFFWLLGGSIGLLAEAEMYEQYQSHGTAIAWLILATPLSLLPVWFLPETAQKSLEEISKIKPKI